MNQIVKLLLLIAFVVSSAFAQCGPPQCYFGCTDASPLVDFVFMIDLSGSMADNIDAVTGGEFYFILFYFILFYFILFYFLPKNYEHLKHNIILIILDLPFFVQNLQNTSINPSYTIVTYAGTGSQQARLYMQQTVIYNLFYVY